jgi:hypothetical protein
VKDLKRITVRNLIESVQGVSICLIYAQIETFYKQKIRYNDT